MVESVELHPSSVVGANPHCGRSQAVVLSSHHQRGEHRRAVGPPPASLRHRFLLAESGDGSVHHGFDAVRGVHFLSVGNHAGEGRLQQLLVQPAVGHGAVEAADGPDAHREGLGLQRAADVAVELGLQRGRRRGAETFRLRFVESPSLLWSGSLSVLHHSCHSWTKKQ